MLPASASVLLGYQGFMLCTEMGLGALAGILTLAGAVKQFRNRSRLGLAGLFFPLLGAYAVALALLPAVYMLVTGLASGWQSPDSLMGMPAYALVTTVLAAAAAAALAHAAVFRGGEGRETTGLHAYIIGLSAVGVAVFMGFTITDTLGERVDTTLRKELFMRVSAVGNALDPNLVGMLQGREEDTKEPPYKALLERLTKIRLANDDLRFVYLTTMRMKDRAIIIILDTEPPTSKDYAKPANCTPRPRPN